MNASLGTILDQLFSSLQIYSMAPSFMNSRVATIAAYTLSQSDPTTQSTDLRVPGRMPRP